jgi:hypothetical protein
MALNFGEQVRLMQSGEFNDMIGKLLIKYSIRTLREAAKTPGSVPPEKLALARSVEKQENPSYAMRVVAFVALTSDEIFSEYDAAERIIEGFKDNSLVGKIFSVFDSSWKIFAPEPPPEQPTTSPKPATSPTPLTTTTAVRL